MHFALIHVAATAPDESDVLVVVPDGSTTVIAVELHALPGFLALLELATRDQPHPRCARCDALLPAGVLGA